jgi:2-oxoglutarate ferredoxin oxidoreductase subunit delta
MYTMAVKTRKFRVTIDKNRCKGCMLCVAFCPRNVLAMQKTEAKVAEPDACIGCQLCEIYCPDFAISVSKIEEKNGK